MMTGGVEDSSDKSRSIDSLASVTHLGPITLTQFKACFFLFLQ